MIADILGFRARVLSRPPEDVVDTAVLYLRRALNFALHQQTGVDPPSLNELDRHSHVGLGWFSDTVILYGRDDSDRTAKTFIDTVGYLAFLTTIPPDARLRIGIDYGGLYVDEPNRIYVGPALVRAYELQEAQDWSGGALTSEARTRLSTIGDTPYVVDYPVPGKNGIVSEHAIDWTSGIHIGEPLAWGPGQPEPPLRTEHSQPDVARKWRNTRRFHAERCEICRVNRR